MSIRDRRLKLEIAYDGSAYHGWQYQDDLPTIQRTIQERLARIIGHDTNVLSCGRTDAGVHAIKQVATFSTSSRLDTAIILRSLNATLPRDIRINSVHDVPWAFHPILDVVAKRYRYLIDDGRPFSPLLRNYCWIHHKPLDENLMREAGQILVGTHDFAAFQTQGSPRESTVRTVTDVSVKRIDSLGFWGRVPDSDTTQHDSLIVIEVEANGFLYNMVRAIVGTLALLGSRAACRESSRARTLTPAWICDLLSHGNRNLAGQTAPAHGLYMLDVRFREAVNGHDAPRKEQPS
ncbi:MAG: tRNA pseudouridine(38-40) synthase TruA [Thermoguttaceae bacterium]